ncbi:MAG TPA: nucleotidyltransferase family protein [Burkholderiaceae bacterium]|nr:nucleotidyltransferase family protein [Burkholderiaceae bacterium]
MSVVGVLLAAGRGSRFAAVYDGDDKLLASCDECGTPVLVASAQPLVMTLKRVIAVVPVAAPARGDLLRAAGCDVVVAHHAHEGMGRMIAFAIEHSPQASGWIIALADMPCVQAVTIQRIATALTHHDRVAPWHTGQRGHPVGFAHQHRDALLQLQGDRGARDLLEPAGVHRLDTNDSGVLIDIDTPADLERARALRYTRHPSF